MKADRSSGLRSKPEPSRLTRLLRIHMAKLLGVTLIHQEPSRTFPGSPASTPDCTDGKSGPDDQPRPGLGMLWAQTPLQSWHKHPAAVTMAIPPLPAFQLQRVKPGGCSHYIFARKLHTQIRNNRWRKRDLLIYSREKCHLQTSRSKMSTNSRNTKSIRNKKMRRFIKRGVAFFASMHVCFPHSPKTEYGLLPLHKIIHILNISSMCTFGQHFSPQN